MAKNGIWPQYVRGTSAKATVHPQTNSGGGAAGPAGPPGPGAGSNYGYASLQTPEAITEQVAFTTLLSIPLSTEENDVQIVASMSVGASPLDAESISNWRIIVDGSPIIGGNATLTVPAAITPVGDSGGIMVVVAPGAGAHLIELQWRGSASIDPVTLDQHANLFAIELLP